MTPVRESSVSRRGVPGRDAKAYRRRTQLQAVPHCSSDHPACPQDIFSFPSYPQLSLTAIYPFLRESPMSRTHKRSFSQGIVPSSTKFTEHLSIAVPPPNPSYERSRFSPDSPTKQVFPLGRNALHRSSPRSRRFDPEKGIPSESHSSSQPSMRDRLARLFPQLRGSRRGDSSVQLVAPPSEVPVWKLDNVRGSEAQYASHVQPLPTCTHKWHNRTLLLALIIFLLYLFINVIVLNVRSFSPSQVSPRTFSSSTTSTTPPASAPTNSMMFSADTQQCITQYTLNAPSDPTGYPCSTCLSLLAAVPANATAVYPVARDATQFCGLRSIWEDAGQQGQAGLEAGGWVKDAKFCAWSGVRCNGAGRVSSLYVLSSSYFFPAMLIPIPLPIDSCPSPLFPRLSLRNSRILQRSSPSKL